MSTIEEILKSKSEQIKNDLQEKGVDITNNNYTLSKEFIKLKNQFTQVSNFTKYRNDWIFEKYQISQERLKNIYGPYAMGIEYNLIQKESICTKAFYDYLEINCINNGTNSTTIDVKQYFERNKDGKNADNRNGIIRKLFLWGLDISKFNNQLDKLKLFYLLFMFENNSNQKIKAFSFLDNPTLENVDVKDDTHKTKNGELLSKLKYEVAKQLTPDFIEFANKTLATIMLEWDDIFNFQRIKHKSQTTEKEITAIKNNIVSISPLNTYESKFSHSLLETFYIKIIQHELLGREKDIIKIQENILCNSSSLYNNISNVFTDKPIMKDQAQTFLNVNKDIIIKTIFDGSDLTKNSNNKYDNAVSNIDFLISFIDLSTNCPGQAIL